MKRTVRFFILSFLASAALADQNGAFQEGKGLGAATTQGVFDSIDSGTVSGKIPAYGASPAETQYYQGGQGQLTGPGVGKMQGCGSYTPGSDKIANQECEAVNFLARNPQVRPQFSITENDPMIIGAKNARDNAENIFQSLGGAGNSSQCTTKTETTPAQYATETCSSIGEIGMEQCAMGRLIDIDTDANFQCEQTVNAYETLTCDDSSVGCTQIGTALQCAPVSTRCWPGADSCCWVTVTCNAGVSVTVRGGDCCGYTYTKTITSVTEFLSGVPYDVAGSKITCNNTGRCTMSFENAYCNNPSVSIGHYDNVNSFNMTTRPTWACSTGGGCEALDARTQ